MSNSQAIVVSSLKHGETSLISSLYLYDLGFKTFIIKGILGSKKSKYNKAHFLPLSIININFSINQSKDIGYLIESKSEIFYETLHTDIEKSSVVIFLSEVLTKVLREETDPNPKLFEFIRVNLIWFDKVEKCNNFHLKFLIELTRFIGFYPSINSMDKYFDIELGSSTNYESSKVLISGNVYEIFKNILGMEFDELNNISITKELRMKILDHILEYYSIHLQMFKIPKSINVFRKIF
ncbi:MAG: DNA repair protein RecO [Bacteroidota bacterium]